MSAAGTPVSFAEVARIWRKWELQPHRVQTFKYNERCQPYAWTKTADDILTKATRPKRSGTQH